MRSLSWLILILMPQALADGVVLSVGQSWSRGEAEQHLSTKADSYRLAYLYSTGYQWSVIANHQLSIELEGALNHWEDPWRDKSKQGASLLPVLRYSIPVQSMDWYLGVGAGASYFSDVYLMDRSLGSRWLFETRFELGVQFARRHRLSYGINHYSNAYLAERNQGANMHYLNYSLLW
ncbi:hypothetical protein GCM10009092_43180 [Bowmanella denitrificans]|uniref:Acyloxyacyl hydrolase n=1 Tax=Bowmanella denitrificans TaxID=366582 RepID=A0ABN0XVX1_9ALTE